MGSTGSVGRQALDVIAAHSERFTVCGLAANTNVRLLAAQAEQFRPARLSLGNPQAAAELARMLGYKPDVIAYGSDGLREIAANSGADVVLAASDGMAALEAVFESVSRGMTVAVANKELIVAAGEPLFLQARRSGARLLPVDSEHSAIFQCVAGERAGAISRVVLTASGGPLWEKSARELADATPAQALRHPVWAMGPKNTLDSATLMNKGLEVIEASRFFGLAPSQIEVVIHRQSIVHAFVVFVDSTVKAQLAEPDMRLPIGYALSFPERLDGVGSGKAVVPGLHSACDLHFEPVDEERFPALRLAYAALEGGGTYPAVLSAANEEAGRAFLGGKVKFSDIARLTQRALDAHEGQTATLDAVRAADRWARGSVHSAIAPKK